MYDRNMEDIKPIDPQVIYDDDFLTVVWQPGQSDFMLVTFGNLINLADGVSFFGDVPVRKLNYTCIGFMAKKPNWFPEESAKKAILSVQKYFYGVSEVVTYGGSMGGYAAIKYSSALKAKTVIAFCPQWSIDKDECGGRNPGFQEYFSPALSGMGIRAEDISGRLFLFFDPNHSNDLYHAHMITQKAAEAKHVLVRSVGHLVTGTLAGTSNMEGMIRMARSNDHHGLSLLANKVRRGHHIRVRMLLNKLSTRHPYLLSRVLKNPRNTEKLGLKEVIALKAEVVKSLSGAGQHSLALEVVDSLQASEICPVRRSLLYGYKHELAKKSALDQGAIRTHHRTYLAFSALDGTLVHRVKDEIASISYLIPVAVYNYSGRKVFGVSKQGRTFVCQVTSAGDVRLGDINGVDLVLTSLIIHSEDKGGAITPTCRGNFVTAEKNGSISFSRQIAKEWETFYLSS